MVRVRSSVITVVASLTAAASIACSDSESASSSTGTNGGAAGPGGTGAGTGEGGAGGEGSGATGTGGGTGGDGGGPPEGLVPAFIAQGHMGRTTLSCDDGQTFVANQSEDDRFLCWQGPDTDCDHNSFAGRGLAYGNGVWIATFGWGAPGTLRRSTNGVDWQVVETDTPTYADVAFGNGVFVTNGSPTRISSDGLTWNDGGDLDLSINTRAIEFIPHADGVFIVTGESGTDRDIVYSADGAAWTHASQRPPECGQYVRNIVYGDGVIAVFSGAGHVCTSTDGGDTWTHHPFTDSLSSGGLWTGTAFHAWSGTTRWTSPDGASWSSEAGGPNGVQIDGPVSLGPSGTFVAVDQTWDGYYEEQSFVHSADGLTWQTASSFVGSHPVNFLQFGYVEPSADCPLP